MKWKQNLQKITAGTVAGALLVVGLSGCDSTTESTSQANTDAQGEAVTINVAYFDSFVWSYYIQIAQKYGIWDSVFGNEPVNVQFTSFSSGPEVNEAITAGDIDIAINEGDQPFLSGVANGVDLTILSTELRQEKTLILVADSNSEIQSAADLKGKNIAVPLGTYVHKSLIGVLQDNGISVDDVQLTNISAAGDAVAAIENGNVDVYIGTIFSLYSEIQDGKIKQIADLTGNGAYAYLIVAVYYIQPLEYYEQIYSVQQAQHKQKFPLYVHLDKYAEWGVKDCEKTEKTDSAGSAKKSL